MKTDIWTIWAPSGVRRKILISDPPYYTLFAHRVILSGAGDVVHADEGMPRREPAIVSRLDSDDSCE